MCPKSTSFSVPKKTKKLEPLYCKGSRRGLYWTRTSDPIDVNEVLYPLSRQAMLTCPVSVASDAYLSTLSRSSRSMEAPSTLTASADTRFARCRIVPSSSPLASP